MKLFYVQRVVHFQFQEELHNEIVLPSIYIYILRTPRVKTIFKKEIFLCQKVYSQNGNHNIGQIRVEQKFSLPRLQEDLC